MDTDATGADWLNLNRANWDERVPIHVASDGFYDLPGFRAGRDSIRPFESAEVGDVTGKTLLHLQCHMGMDTLSWARRGATVTGLDFSAPAVEQARGLASDLGVTDARFVVSDVYEAASALPGERFDVVYTGLGALCWLPDVDRWAEVVAGLLTAGGFLYLSEFHPIVDVVAEDGRTLAGDYFRTEGTVWDEPGTYTDPDPAAPSAMTATVTVEWTHGIGQVVSALIRAGLALEFLHEHDHTLFQHLPTLERRDGAFRPPAGGARIPLMYSLRARKP